MVLALQWLASPYIPGFSFLLVEASFSILIGSGQGNFLLTDPQQASVPYLPPSYPTSPSQCIIVTTSLIISKKRDHDLNPDYSSNSQCQADVGI